MSESKQELTRERRAQILEAATAVFAQHGYHQARMDDIVKTAGLSKGAVYWYFDSKEQLFLSLLDRILQRELEAMQNFQGAPGSLRERINAMLTLILDHLAESEELLPIMYEFYAAAARDASVREAVLHYLVQYRNLLRTMIEAEIEKGDLRNVDSEISANVLAGYMEGMLLMWVMGLLQPSSHSVAEQATFGMNLIMDGLARPQQRGQG